MLTEHGHGRGHISAMSSALEGMKAGDQGPAQAFVESARQYIDLLTNHISKENDVLFPMAEKTLPAQTLQAIYEEFERIETERIGEGRHEAFHKMIDELARVYL